MADCHVHAAPDVVDRLGDDLDTCDTYERACVAGFVLKGTTSRPWAALMHWPDAQGWTSSA